ncbi:hypothetical protein TSUD_130860 [Trifolium subterraneum]|nr:hypothetical protein TSUD_130860 [Trifolium subterraneum]
MHERTFGQFARVLVDMDLSQPLRYKVLVERKGFAFFVEIEYENIPDFCNSCQVIGHHVDNCKKWNKDEVSKTDKDTNTRKNIILEPKKIFVQTNVGRPQQSKNKEVINVERETINVEETSENSQHISLKGKNLVTKEPDITQQKQNASEKIVDTVLSPRALLKVQDNQLEEELNEHLNDKDLNASASLNSFVADTQNQSINTSASSASDESRQTPVRVLKDMAFLKESWANMAEADEEARQALEEPETDNNDDGYTVQLSKSQKKKRAQKKKKQSSRDSYATRSKVSPIPLK